jgi:uncharacterized membrane protein
MAGIGFKLQKLLHEGTYFGALKGFFFATYLVAGPWIVTISVIGLLTWVSGLSGRDYDIFRTSIVYLYAFSLIFTGLYQMPLTRFLADEMYSGRIKSLASSYLGMAMLISLLMGGAGFAYSLILPLSWLYRTTFVSGLVIVSLLWLAGIYLGCLRDYEKIGVYYLLGSFISLFGTIIGEQNNGLDGAFLGFVVGQGVILIGLTIRILRELGFISMMPSLECLGSLRKFPLHLLAGLTYNIAIWIDKMVFWFSPYGQTACRGLYSFGPYDTPIFLAYMTIIPALGIYLMNIETDFYDTYRNFYGSIMRQLPLHNLQARLTDIRRNLRFTFFEMVKFQGAITFLVFYFAPEILEKIEYPVILANTVRWGVWAAFFQVLFLFVSLLLLYFEFPWEACIGNALYLIINATVTFYVCYFGDATYYALGYFVSTLTSFLICGHLLLKRLDKLIPITFLRQPIPGEILIRKGLPSSLRGGDGFLGEIVFTNPEFQTAEKETAPERRDPSR